MQWDRDCCKKAWGSSGPHFEGFHFFTVHRTLAFRSCEPLVKLWDHKELPTLREHFKPTTKIHRMLRLQLRNTKTVKKKATEKYREDPPCNFLYKIATVKLGKMVRFRALLCFRGTYPVSTFAIL